jgi:hypothetical protein
MAKGESMPNIYAGKKKIMIDVISGPYVSGSKWLKAGTIALLNIKRAITITPLIEIRLKKINLDGFLSANFPPVW